MSEFIPAQELLERWQIYGFELVWILRDGRLHPVDDLGMNIYHPDQKKIVDKYEKLMASRRNKKNSTKESRGKLLKKIRDYKRDHDLGSYGWEIFTLPKNKRVAKRVISTITSCYYMEDEIKRIEKDEKLVKFFKIQVPYDSEAVDNQANDSSVDNSISEKTELLKAIGKEAEEIYEHFKKIVGVTDKSMRSRVERRDCAIVFFKKNEHTFNHIKETHLEDPYIYDFKSNQAKRDYMSRLLSSVFAEVFSDSKHPGRKLYDDYKLLR